MAKIEKSSEPIGACSHPPKGIYNQPLHWCCYWITLAFDVFSRMVTDFYVSFDPPSALLTGLCLAQSILPKEKYLARFNVKGEWPVWGHAGSGACRQCQGIPGQHAATRL
ncbi:hypothetical protein [Gynuella sunshinyii]|uniref:hypothetical protein n=1 Tax=Gynuella sunshinyii TaxID=1445505 RepID=UPI0005CC8B52|nr:hypothetical protein [Gynuella sunshinyii]